uniref:Pentatricopeptide repeat-containing protein n=1 Tax=Kalanchoe fedtschenkoi TaxID=63787 RepID=A0A7N0U9U7_KALFE
MVYAERAFRELEAADGFLWNTMIRGFGICGESGKAFEWYGRMKERGVVADNFTFCFLLKVCGGSGCETVLGKQLHCCVMRHGLDSHVFVRNSLIHMYGMFGEIEVARQLFDEITDPELVAWNTVIDCCVSCGEFEEAMKLFEAMLARGIEPDEASLVVTLSACSATGALDFGRWVHSLVDEKGLGGVVTVCNSLVDMYAKCGAVEAATRIFDGINGRNIVSWNAMISGMAMHGHGNEALGLFSRMLDENLVCPNEVTFLGVLCACNHNGFVELGRRYFASMVEDYGLKPTIKHYGCMVDVLGRCGFVGEAYQLIQSMPMECNAVVWRTLLAACRVHGEVELGEVVRKHLLEIEPDHSSDYVLLANMYADSEQWSKTARVRKSMRNRRVQKPVPGNSSVLRAGV